MYQTPSHSIDDLKTITATFGTIVAGIVGYYFGQRPTEQATKSAQENRTKRQAEAGADITEIKDALSSWKENRENLRTLNSMLGEQ
jgi:hypothetical protein